MTLPSKYLELARCSGVCLDQINPGSTEVAFTRELALNALSLLEGTSVAVLGGDVLRCSQDGKLEYVYANWWSEQDSSEDISTYAERSQREAMSYVANFQGSGEFEPLFVFVLS